MMKSMFHSHEIYSQNTSKATSRLPSDHGGAVTAPGVDIPDLAPGEPVPPGFEDIVTRVPEITSTLDDMKSPLVGLEFLAEISPQNEEGEPKYCCLLCNKRGDPRTVLAHLVCFNHRNKYIARYFPRVNTALAKIPKMKEYKRGIGECLARIARAIENKFGRLNPVIVDGSDFDQKKEEYYVEMCAGRHFHETADTNFESLVDLEFIKKCAPQTDLVSNSNTALSRSSRSFKIYESSDCLDSSNFDNVLTIDLEKEEAKKKSCSIKYDDKFQTSKKHTNEQRKKPLDKPFKPGPKRRREKSVETISTLSSDSRSRSRSRSWSRSRSVSRSRSWSRSVSRSRSRSRYRYMYRDYKRDDSKRSPRYYRRSRSRSRNNSSSYRHYRNSNYRNRPLSRDNYRSSRYSSVYDDAYYSERPKSTQLKVAELRDKRRKKDLYQDFVVKLEKDMAKILKGYEKNPEKHPSYPEEWKKFWNRRYKELTAEGIDASKHDFKPEWIKFWTNRMKELHNEELQMKKEKYRSELGLPDTDSSAALDSDVIEVSPTPLEDDKSNITVEDIKHTWKVLTGGEIRGANFGEESFSTEKSDEFEQNSEPEQPVRVITVLRLLTALESQLGSLGPRVNNLLAQAIALEKKRENSSDSLLDISENSVLFETVKEKLKGQLFAGIVSKPMVKATRSAIQKVAELFNEWKIKKNSAEISSAASVPILSGAVQATVHAPPVSSSGDPLIVPGIGAVDKLAIAQQIASALVAQGKTNITEQELEQLINAVVGMAQASSQQSQSAPSALVSSPATSTQVIPSGLSPGILSNIKNEEDLERSKRTGEISDSRIFSFKNVQSSSSEPSTLSRTLPKDLSDLTEEEIKVSLQNFKDLSPEEQQTLISYLKELESKDPVSVEKLKKFILLANDPFPKSDFKMKEEPLPGGRLSPFSMREGGANPFIDDKSKIVLKDEEDEEDYSFEEIYKAAEKKVSGRSIVEQMIEEQKKKSKKVFEASPKKESSLSATDNRNHPKSKTDDPQYLLSETIVMIDNIMGQLPSKYAGGSTRMNNGKTNLSGTKARAETSVDPQLAEKSPMSQTYGNNLSKSTPQENNLLNDYNYQDEVFGYGNENYQNYPPANSGTSYRCPINNEPSYDQRPPQYENYDNKPMEPSYNYESWNENFAHYPPPQVNSYDCHQSLPNQSLQPPFNGPPIYQVPPNDFSNIAPPPYGNNMYRGYY